MELWGQLRDSCGTAGYLGAPSRYYWIVPPFPDAASVCGERRAHSLGSAYSGNYTSGNNTQPDE